MAVMDTKKAKSEDSEDSGWEELKQVQKERTGDEPAKEHVTQHQQAQDKRQDIGKGEPSTPFFRVLQLLANHEWNPGSSKSVQERVLLASC